MKYSMSLREIPRAKRQGFPEGSGYISSYIPTQVTIQTLSFLEINIGRVDSLFCSDCWAIGENITQ